MSFKVYNFRYNRSTKPGSMREVLVSSDEDVSGRITGYDRLADSHEGGMRKFDKDQMTRVIVYEVTKVIECKDEKSAMELESLGGYDRFGSVVVISKKRIPSKPEPKIELRGRVDKGYVKITYGGASIDLPLTGGNGAGYVYAGYDTCGRDFEGCITRLYNEIQKNKK